MTYALRLPPAKPDPTDALEGVTEAERAYVAARQNLDDAVARARANGASWQQIGRALGVTRQWAWQRFGP